MIQTLKIFSIFILFSFIPFDTFSLDTISYSYDVKYYELNLSVVPAKKEIEGFNNIFIQAEKDLDTVRINLFENLIIDSILVDKHKLSFHRIQNQVFIPLKSKLLKDSKATIEVHYHGSPVRAANAPWDGGFVWSKDSLDNDWVTVACEGKGASLWWPCKEDASDEPDSMQISITCPSNLFCVSNGTLEKIIEHPKSKTYCWKIHYPINNYNVTLNIGNYKYYSETLWRADRSQLHLDYYVLSYNLAKAKKHFEQVKKILTAFEKYFGEYPFPKDGYALVETPYWGMEHQSAIAYGNHFKNNLGPFDFIIAHESAHEWWGNSITAHDIGQLWIHESFATYAESLLLENYEGKDSAVKYLELQKHKILNEQPMLQVSGSFRPEDTDIYYKGTWMLHTLRNVINDNEKWFQLLRELAISKKHQIVTTEEIITFFNKQSGKDLTSVFNQYLKHTEIPVFEYELKIKKHKLVISYKWKVAEPKFEMPVWINAGNKVIILPCTTKPKKKTLKGVTADNFRVMTEQEYIELNRLFKK